MKTKMSRLGALVLMAVVGVLASPLGAFASEPEAQPSSTAYDNAPIILIVTGIIAVVVALIYEGIHRRKRRNDEDSDTSDDND